MRLKSYVLLAILALAALVLAGCPPVIVTVPSQDVTISQGTALEVDLANPAATFCLDMGYIYQVRAASDGSQYGVCIFPGVSECDGWAYFRGECGPTSRQYDLESNQALYCINQGHMLEVRNNAFGQYGVCKFPDGTQCAADAFLAGYCGPQPEASIAEILGTGEVAAPAEGEAMVAEGEAMAAEGEAMAAEGEAMAAEGEAAALAEGEAAALAEGEAAALAEGEAAAPAEGEVAAPAEGEVAAPAEGEAAAPAEGEAMAAEGEAMAAETVVSVVNVVAAAGLLGSTQVDVLMGDADVASISDPADVQALVDALNATLPLIPRNRCLSTYTLRFHLAGDAVQNFSYTCGGNLANATLRGDQAFWAGQDVMAPEVFNQLMAGHLAGIDP